MARLVKAAALLAAQVQAQRKRAKWSEAGEPDGLGVVRMIRFDKATSKWLEPLLEEIADERIEWFAPTEAGYLYVKFVATPVADRHDPFPLEAAAEVRGQ